MLNKIDDALDDDTNQIKQTLLSTFGKRVLFLHCNLAMSSMNTRGPIRSIQISLFSSSGCPLLHLFETYPFLKTKPLTLALKRVHSIIQAAKSNESTCYSQDMYDAIHPARWQ